MALEANLAKMVAAGVNESCRKAFALHLQRVANGETGCIPESTIEPVQDLPVLDRLTVPVDKALLGQTVLLKLNGGLGTGMGLSAAKSLIRVKGDDTFLDLTIKQVLHLRQTTGFNVRFMLMNSFSTSADTEEFLRKYAPFHAVFKEEVELFQNKIPKVRQDNLEPASYPADTEMEWVPPGHGDLYAALYSSGKLEALIKGGYKYLFVSNSDNLGATLDLKALSYFAREKLDFMMEVCERAAADRKGGHLARAKDSGRLLLRESAQCLKEDEAQFQNIDHHRFFNSNNLWINLEALLATMQQNNGVMPLPTIRNAKTVNPTDSKSTKVYQLETAMGSAIALFPHSSAIVVSRERFAPVKTTNDLLSLRSDAYVLTDDYRIVLDPRRRGVPPVVALQDSLYKFTSQLEAMIHRGAPSMVQCDSLTVAGPVTFDKDVVLKGTVAITVAGEEVKAVSAGEYSGVVTL